MGLGVEALQRCLLRFELLAVEGQLLVRRLHRTHRVGLHISPAMKGGGGVGVDVVVRIILLFGGLLSAMASKGGKCPGVLRAVHD
jgi:hypothetical protein